MIIQILWSLKLIKVCCEENIFTFILSNSHIILHVMHVTHSQSGNQKIFERNFESCLYLCFWAINTRLSIQ